MIPKDLQKGLNRFSEYAKRCGRRFAASKRTQLTYLYRSVLCVYHGGRPCLGPEN